MVTTFKPSDPVLVTSKHNPEISFEAGFGVQTDLLDPFIPVIPEGHLYALELHPADWTITPVEPPLVLPVGTVVDFGNPPDFAAYRMVRMAYNFRAANGDESFATDDDIRAAIKSGEARVVPVEELEQEARR